MTRIEESLKSACSIQSATATIFIIASKNLKMDFRFQLDASEVSAKESIKITIFIHNPKVINFTLPI